MSRLKLENRNTRKLSKMKSSYYITLPIEGIRKLDWKKTQKVVVEVDEKRRRFIVKDWKK